MHHPRTLALVIAGLAAAGRTASADPGFMTLDRQDAISRFGGEVSYQVIDEDALDVTSFRFDVHGQYVMPSGFGFYGVFPLSYASGDGASATGIGNIEVGGIFLPRMANPNFTLALHGGLTVPTASNDLEPVIANAYAISARVTDIVQVIPEGMTLRLGASPMFRSGQFFGRLDGGIDINLSNDSEETVDPLIRINFGGGFDFGGGAVTGEVVNLISTDDSIGDNSVTAFAFSFRGVAGGVRPYAGVVLPLDNDLAADLSVTGGIEGILQ